MTSLTYTKDDGISVNTDIGMSFWFEALFSTISYFLLYHVIT